MVQVLSLATNIGNFFICWSTPGVDVLLCMYLGIGPTTNGWLSCALLFSLQRRLSLDTASTIGTASTVYTASTIDCYKQISYLWKKFSFPGLPISVNYCVATSKRRLQNHAHPQPTVPN